jgi:hypothetical protein
MKRILLLCAFFMGSLVFACDSPLHGMFHEAASLKSAGYHAEAIDLLSDITGADICNFSAGEMRCYNSTARKLYKESKEWNCPVCSNYGNYPIPEECDVCHHNLDELKYLINK